MHLVNYNLLCLFLSIITVNNLRPKILDKILGITALIHFIAFASLVWFGVVSLTWQKETVKVVLCGVLFFKSNNATIKKK